MSETTAIPTTFTVHLKHGTFYLATPIAAGLSYATHHSFWWALVHGCLHWAYIAYWVASRYAG